MHRLRGPVTPDGHPRATATLLPASRPSLAGYKRHSPAGYFPPEAWKGTLSQTAEGPPAGRGHARRGQPRHHLPWTQPHSARGWPVPDPTSQMQAHDREGLWRAAGAAKGAGGRGTPGPGEAPLASGCRGACGAEAERLRRRVTWAPELESHFPHRVPASVAPPRNGQRLSAVPQGGCGPGRARTRLAGSEGKQSQLIPTRQGTPGGHRVLRRGGVTSASISQESAGTDHMPDTPQHNPKTEGPA